MVLAAVEVLLAQDRTTLLVALVAITAAYLVKVVQHIHLGVLLLEQVTTSMEPTIMQVAEQKEIFLTAVMVVVEQVTHFLDCQIQEEAQVLRLI
jgi:hypothetical protein